MPKKQLYGDAEDGSLPQIFWRSFRAWLFFYYSWGSAALHPRLSSDRAFGA